MGKLNIIQWLHIKEDLLTSRHAVADTESYAWSSDKTSVATVASSTSNTTTATGVAAGTANIKAVLTATDTAGKVSTSSASAPLTVTAAPATKAHAKTGTVSLSSSAATVGTAFTSNASISSLVDADDGSYTYAWSFNVSNSGLSFSSTSSKTPTITGTPTTAQSVSVRCSVKDSYGAYATITAATIVVSAAAGKAKLTSVAPSAITGKVGTSLMAPIVWNCSAADDGSYSYVFTAMDGKSTGAGYLWYSTDGGTTKKQGAANATYTNNTLLYVGCSTSTGAPTKAGSPSFTYKVTDSFGTSKTGTLSITIS